MNRLSRARLASWALAAIGACAVVAGLWSPAEAVPAWTRKTGIDCSACHFGGTNRLTETGVRFLLRGHRTAGDEGAYTENAGVKLADYLSFASKFRYTANKDADPSTGFDTESLSIYSGGPLTGKYSYFFEFYLHERGKMTSSKGDQVDTATRSKLADAYLQYNSNPGADAYWFVRAGQIYPYLIYTAGSGGRVSIDRPAAINSNFGGGNLFTPRDRSYGMSVGGVTPRNFRYEAGIVNGGGTNARSNLEEVNNSKDIFFTAQQVLDGSGSAIGLYTYFGRYLTLPVSASSKEESFSRIGLLAQVQRNRFELSGAVMLGSHANPAGTGRRSPSAYFIEGACNFTRDLTAYARWDSQDNDLTASSATKKALLRATGGTLGISQRLQKIGRIATELHFTRNTTVNDDGTGSKKSSSTTWVTELNWLF